MNAPRALPAELEADLELSGPDGERLHITGSGARVQVAAADLRSLWRLMRQSQGFVSRETLTPALALIARSGVELDVTIRNITIASVVPAGRGSLIARAIGFKHIRIRPIALLRAIFR